MSVYSELSKEAKFDLEKTKYIGDFCVGPWGSQWKCEKLSGWEVRAEKIFNTEAEALDWGRATIVYSIVRSRVVNAVTKFGQKHSVEKYAFLWTYLFKDFNVSHLDEIPVNQMSAFEKHVNQILSSYKE